MIDPSSEWVCEYVSVSLRERPHEQLIHIVHDNLGKYPRNVNLYGAMNRSIDDADPEYIPACINWTWLIKTYKESRWVSASDGDWCETLLMFYKIECTFRHINLDSNICSWWKPNVENISITLCIARSARWGRGEGEGEGGDSLGGGLSTFVLAFCFLHFTLCTLFFWMLHIFHPSE